MALAYIGLGANLAQPVQQLQRALEDLTEHRDIHLRRCSPLYWSTAVGPGEQEDYCNAVAELETSLAPLVLLDVLQQQENAQGRVRRERWGARLIDLDLLAVEQESQSVIHHCERLSVPHREIHWRNFVLAPLFDLRPDMALPGQGRVDVLLQACSGVGLRRVDGLPLSRLIDKESS